MSVLPVHPDSYSLPPFVSFNLQSGTELRSGSGWWRQKRKHSRALCQQKVPTQKFPGIVHSEILQHSSGDSESAQRGSKKKYQVPYSSVKAAPLLTRRNGSRDYLEHF